MSDSYGDPQKGKSINNFREGARGGFKSGRGPNNREQGGFRIRLSDNEINAAKTIQEAFNLRSTVAVLGFSLRTLAQMLEGGKLDQLVAEHQSNEQNINSAGKGNRKEASKNKSLTNTSRANPFARPEKPISAEVVEDSKKEEVVNLDSKTSDNTENTDISDESKNDTGNEKVSTSG